MATTAPGRREAAVALVAMGPERAATVLRGLTEREVRTLMHEITALGPVQPDEVVATMRRLMDGLASPSSLPAPGKRFAKDLLVRTLGSERGAVLSDELDIPAPFAWLADADPDAVVPVLASEPAGALALALAHLQPLAAARILTRLPEATRAQVATRIASLGAVHPDTVIQVEMGLRQRVEDVLRSEVRKVDGPELLANLLAKAGRDTSRELLDVLATAHPELAEATRARLFTFDDVCALPARTLQIMLRAVDTRQLALALSGTGDTVTGTVLGNLSERARETVLEEIDLVRDARPAEVAEARTAVVAAARKLEEDGQIVLAREGDEADL